MVLETDIEASIYLRLREELDSSSIQIRRDDIWSTPLLKRHFDIVVYKGVNPLAVFEIKRDLSNKNTLAIASDQIRSALSITNARYGIISDGIKFYIYDRAQKEDDFKATSLEYILSTLNTPNEIKLKTQDKRIVANIFEAAVKKYLPHNPLLYDFIVHKSFYSYINFDTKTNCFIFSDSRNGRSYENDFFEKMFGVFNERKICRYTSLRTVFEMLNNLSCRMSGIVGMNDKSEVNYVENYLNQGNSLISIEKPLHKEHYNTIIAINKRYITSCSKIERKDDLALWRLYADDASGVCLEFNIKKENLNSSILLQNVKYADADGRHSELELIKDIKLEIARQTGFEFDFRKLAFWKHFFKPHDYAIEEEVRLLIVDDQTLPKLKTDWVMTYSHNIINPVIDFRLNSKLFPIQLEKVILGPKCPEQDSNCVQIEEMIRRKKKEIEQGNLDSNLNKLKVEMSNIKNYR